MHCVQPSPGNSDFTTRMPLVNQRPRGGRAHVTSPAASPKSTCSNKRRGGARCVTVTGLGGPTGLPGGARSLVLLPNAMFMAFHATVIVPICPLALCPCLWSPWGTARNLGAQGSPLVLRSTGKAATMWGHSSDGKLLAESWGVPLPGRWWEKPKENGKTGGRRGKRGTR